MSKMLTKNGFFFTVNITDNGKKNFKCSFLFIRYCVDGFENASVTATR
jgi:hypothetical protein